MKLGVVWDEGGSQRGAGHQPEVEEEVQRMLAPRQRMLKPVPTGEGMSYRGLGGRTER